MSASVPSRYEIRVAGHLDDHWSGVLGGLAVIRHDDGTTVLSGVLVDQAQLHGVLATLRDLGAPLVSLRRADPASNDASDGAAAPPRER